MLPDMITKEMKEREAAIAAFDEQYCFGRRIKGNRKLRKELKRYDVVVCGSDQLWAPSNVISDYFTLTIIPTSIRKISYAASFGVDKVPNVLKCRYKRFLSRFEAISVREERGRELIYELIGRDAKVVLDPTLMLEKEEWNYLSEQSRIKIGEPYIFCYFLGTNQKHRDFAKELAKRTQTKIVTFPHFKIHNTADENFGDEPIYNAGPIEFLRLIRNAEYVCTDSFHGTVFSLIFERSVAVFERFEKDSAESTNSRIYTLLDNVGILDSIYRDEKDVESYLSNKIDYEAIQKKLDYLREKSFRFLDEAIQCRRCCDD